MNTVTSLIVRHHFVRTDKHLRKLSRLVYLTCKRFLLCGGSQFNNPVCHTCKRFLLCGSQFNNPVHHTCKNILLCGSVVPVLFTTHASHSAVSNTLSSFRRHLKTQCYFQSAYPAPQHPSPMRPDSLLRIYKSITYLLTVCIDVDQLFTFSNKLLTRLKLPVQCCTCYPINRFQNPRAIMHISWGCYRVWQSNFWGRSPFTIREAAVISQVKK